jgi:hypothetical protein
MTKTKTINLRAEPQIRLHVENYAKTHNVNLSEAVCRLVADAVETAQRQQQAQTREQQAA